MSLFRTLSGGVLLLALTLTAAAPGASAASYTGGPATYAGQFGPTGQHVQYVGCTTRQPANDQPSGPWSVTTHGRGADASFTIYVNGTLHVSYKAHMKEMYSTAPVYFVVFMQTLAGPETVTLYTDGHLTYTIAPYDYDGKTCQSVTYPGTGAPQT